MTAAQQVMARLAALEPTERDAVAGATLAYVEEVVRLRRALQPAIESADAGEGVQLTPTLLTDELARRHGRDS